MMKKIVFVLGSGGNQGTFQLKDGAKKSGNQYEDPIEDAIIASNSPKDCGIARLHRYLLDYHLEYDIDNNPQRLRAAILRAEEKGWIKRYGRFVNFVFINSLEIDYFYFVLQNFRKRYERKVQTCI